MSNIRVHLDLAEDLPTISADPHQLQQVFLNMVNNAVDAILESSEDGDLWVTTRADHNSVYVEFTDSGPGVQEASRVFDPFYTTKPVGKGTGLGLSICYGIVTEHGGTIRVRNLPHRGASFTIEMPLGIVSGPATASELSEKSALILCIDADQTALKSFDPILRAAGHRVHSAANGEEVSRMLDQFDFDVVLVAHGATESGPETSLADWLAANRPSLAPRTIRIYPAGSPTNIRADGQVDGFVSLKKPINMVQLLDAINRMLSSRVAATTVLR
jgi:two-component system, NtrC family, sensor kinase